MQRHESDRTEGIERVSSRRLLLLVSAVVLLGACGGSPLESLGWRSSDWINEPTVPTTIAVSTTVPALVGADELSWANDEIDSENLGDQEAILADVFARRQGDRFIQASRYEIAAALPDIAFPDRAPSGAEWVSSQLVFDDDGTLAADPSAAFGIWSAEPYTRSRSVAQMIVMRVSSDLEAATEIASGEVEPSCARFSDRTTEGCELLKIGDRDVWLLRSSSGPTFIWYEGPYRYELFGRSFVPQSVLREMTANMVALSSVGADGS